MLDQENLRLSPPRQLSDEEFLDLAEREIRAFGRSIAHGIVEIGKKLAGVKERVGHEKYQAFVRGRLHFSEDTALNFVRSSARASPLELTDLIGESARWRGRRQLSAVSPFASVLPLSPGLITTRVRPSEEAQRSHHELRAQ
jgi:hypothetical protein